ncbi:MAG: L-threonylcarbamoyladenylate synthase [Prevotella sp.]|nr:L-threonylcarbamoyladenylate synthase [Staphylococcus sp.]MCM1350333.1 L-threonylcarbamoyladenylate synthase [Prevotella sp.]
MKISTIEPITKDTLQRKIIAFPTDTVYGVGAMITDTEAIEKIYRLKQRDFQKPLAILAASKEDILPYIETPSPDVFALMEQYWPGPLTIVFRKSKEVSNQLTRGLDTIGFRIPNEPVTLQLLKQVGPLATTSINISGEPPLNDPRSIEQAFGNQIDYLYAHNVQASQVSSTVIDATQSPIVILRQGEIHIQ